MTVVPPSGTYPDPTVGPLRLEEPPPSRPGRLSSILLTTTFLLIILAAVAVFIPLPYVVFKPGPATNTLGTLDGAPVIEVKDGTTTYPTTGSLDFTTVRIAGGPGFRVTAYDVIEGWLSSTEAVVPEKDVFPPDLTENQVEQENETMMTDSQQVASAIALKALGQKVIERMTVAAVPKGSPGTGVLKPGDVLLTIGGKPITDADSVRAAVQAHGPGESLAVTVRRDGTTTKLTTTTGKGPDGGTVIGILLGVSYDLPVNVVVNAGRVGGPSAGMMFALGIYDKLSPGALTGGKNIAGTGTIGTDGSVGPIDGIAQKMAGARAAGATWFLAPAPNCSDVVGHVPDGMHVVKVSTFDDALGAVKDIAAGETTGLAPCTAAAAS